MSPVFDLSFQLIVHVSYHQHYVVGDADCCKLNQKILSFVPFSEQLFSSCHHFKLLFMMLQQKLCN